MLRAESETVGIYSTQTLVFKFWTEGHQENGHMARYRAVSPTLYWT